MYIRECTYFVGRRSLFDFFSHRAVKISIYTFYHASVMYFNVNGLNLSCKR